MFPDYTRVTGTAHHTQLPFKEAFWHWKYLSATVEPPGEAPSMSTLSDSVVGDGAVYFGDDVGRMFALRVEDGGGIWMYDHGERISSSPALDQDYVYFGSRSGITALDRKSGKRIWHHAVRHGADEAIPLPVGNRVFASGYDGKAYALDRRTGAVLWQYDFAEDAPRDPPAFPSERARFEKMVARPTGSATDGKLFFQCIHDQSRLLVLDCDTGEKVWSFQAEGFTAAAPTVVGSRVYFGSQDRHLYCLDRETGLVVWKFQAPTWLGSRPAVHDGRVFLTVHGARLYQLHADSGDVLHIFQPSDEFERKALVSSFPIVANGAVHFAAGDGQFYAVDIRSNQLRWKLHTSDRSELFTDPVTDGVRIFVTSRQRDNRQGESAILVIGPRL
jgi:outer membrane protein assembly factor BamB